MLLVSYTKQSLPNPLSWCFSPMLPSRIFIVLGLTFRSWVHLEFLCKISTEFHSLAYVYPVLPTPCVEKTVLSPLCNLTPLSKIIWSSTQGIFLGCQFCSLVCMSVFKPVSHCLDYYCFVVCFEIRKYEVANFVLFQNWFGYSGFLRFHMNFRMILSICGKMSLGFW